MIRTILSLVTTRTRLLNDVITYSEPTTQFAFVSSPFHVLFYRRVGVRLIITQVDCTLASETLGLIRSSMLFTLSISISI